MFNVSKLSNKDRDSLFSSYEFQYGVNKVIVEKDFWVTFLLDYLFHKSIFKDYFIFKGGTSLSKCYSLINRFSEDIDLILKWNYITEDNPNNERSNAKQLKYNKNINKLTATFLKEKFVPTLINDLKNFITDDFKLEVDPTEPQTVKFSYPRLYNANEAGILQYIKLEIGPLAALTPTEFTTISPMIVDLNLPILTLKATSIETVSPIRTFWEKVTILHQEANRPKKSFMPSRYSRHYYDVYCIGHSKYKDLAINNLDLLKKVAMFKKKFYPRNWAKYDEAYPNTLKLLPPSYRYPDLKSDYLNMKEMIYKNAPSFEEVMDYLKELEEEINSR
ncbi:MAG: nucleotidyl transferase AbiEii/AbiGii toxin family protein [Bacilli bacterium]|jgi:hypothetical protein